MSYPTNCPNCNASVYRQVLRSVPDEVYCTTCMCVWLFSEHRILLKAVQIFKMWASQ